MLVINIYNSIIATQLDLVGWDGEDWWKGVSPIQHSPAQPPPPKIQPVGKQKPKIDFLHLIQKNLTVDHFL